MSIITKSLENLPWRKEMPDEDGFWAFRHNVNDEPSGGFIERYDVKAWEGLRYFFLEALNVSTMNPERWKEEGWECAPVVIEGCEDWGELEQREPSPVSQWIQEHEEELREQYGGQMVAVAAEHGVLAALTEGGDAKTFWEAVKRRQEELGLKDGKLLIMNVWPPGVVQM